MIVIVVASTAWAYTWDSVEAPTGNTMTIQLCESNFTAAQVTQIFTAANAWRSGTGELIRGANWTYVRGVDRTAGSCTVGNNYNEIMMRDSTWFANHGATAALAVTYNYAVSVSSEVDFVFNSTYTWVNDFPSRVSPGSYSIGQVALHEFGHGLGFNHQDVFIATMNGAYPNGGELAGNYRPNEDDYVGIRTERPHTSTGVNLLLNKFVENTPPNSKEVWNSNLGPFANPWQVCDYLVDPTLDGPEAIYAIIHETSGTVTPEVRWKLSADTTCFSGLEYTVGTRFPGLTSNTPYLIQPNSYDFRGVPAGPYYVCARIDPGALVTETSESDNDLRSEVTLEVIDCP